MCSDRAGHSGDMGEGHVRGIAFGIAPAELSSGSSEPTGRLGDAIVANPWPGNADTVEGVVPDDSSLLHSSLPLSSEDYQADDAGDANDAAG